MTKKEVLRVILLTNAKIHAEGSSSSLAEVFRRQKQVKSLLEIWGFVVVMVG
jgi:hypothetical protein